MLIKTDLKSNQAAGVFTSIIIFFVVASSVCFGMPAWTLATTTTHFILTVIEFERFVSSYL